MVTCVNCRKQFKYIYKHIKLNDECAQFYDLHDEKKKYNSNDELKASNRLAALKYKMKLTEEKRLQHQYHRHLYQKQKKENDRLMEDLFQDEIEIKNEALEIGIEEADISEHFVIIKE